MLDEQTPADADQNATDQSSTAGDTTPAAAPEPGAEPEAAPAPRKRAPRKTAAKRVAAEPEAGDGEDAADAPTPVKKAAARKTAAKRTTKKAAAPEPTPDTDEASDGATAGAEETADTPAPRAARKAPAKRASRARKAAEPVEGDAPAAEGTSAPATEPAAEEPGERSAAVPLFQAPAEPAAKRTAKKTTAKKSTAKKAAAKKAAAAPADEELPTEEQVEEQPEQADEQPETATTPEEQAETGDRDEQDEDGAEGEGDGQPRRRRRRGGRRRRRGGSGSSAGGDSEDSEETTSGEDESERDEEGGQPGPADSEAGEGGGSSSSRRRRRRRRSSDGDTEATDDPENTVTRVRKARSAEDEITGFTGSTRLEAKKQRRREGREAGRRRAPIISEAEFLARRESVERTMVIRQREDLTQIAVLEDKVLVEHYVARESQTSLIGNVYLGRVQNVLPSMEAAFIDIGKGRNAVLYAGEVNWDALGAKDGSQRKIEQVLKSGQSVLVQVTKDPIGHKGARLTSQISLPGRFLVYVPDGTTSGISRKLPDKERTRLKTLLKEIVPEDAGVIVRTAAEGAEEKELVRDVERLKALWEDISAKVEKGNAPQLLYGEPDLTLKVVRDLFTEDIGQLVVSGAEAWEMVDNYVRHIAPDLVDRLERHDDRGGDAFAAYRIDEQIAKALDRKVWLPSGGSLVIDRTEAMTVVDVNTGKFTGSGGNLEETVTKNNLEAAEEIVRQLRLRDIGGIIVVDFIDMVLESNRDLVLRRLVECLGRDRTRHQVAEVTSLGLVQMTRKRIGTGLLEAFSESCEHCQGRGLITHHEPVEPKKRQQNDDEPRRSRRGRGRGRSDDQGGNGDNAGDSGKQGSASPAAPAEGLKRPTPAEFAAMARAEAAEEASAEASAAEGGESSEAVTPPTPPQPEPQKAEPEPEPQKVEPEPEPQKPEPEPQKPEPEPQTESAAPQPEPASPLASQADGAEPAAPKIVTSVRRIGARRAAGPPRGASDGEADAGSEAVGSPVEAEPVQVHVPVKKKGSRK